MPSEFVTDQLPIEAVHAGMELIWHRDSGDIVSQSVTLVNEKRQALFYWPYNPSYAEVREKAMELLQEGRVNA